MYRTSRKEDVGGKGMYETRKIGTNDCHFTLGVIGYGGK